MKSMYLPAYSKSHAKPKLAADQRHPSPPGTARHIICPTWTYGALINLQWVSCIILCFVSKNNCLALSEVLLHKLASSENGEGSQSCWQTWWHRPRTLQQQAWLIKLQLATTYGDELPEAHCYRNIGRTSPGDTSLMPTTSDKKRLKCPWMSTCAGAGVRAGEERSQAASEALAWIAAI